MGNLEKYLAARYPTGKATAQERAERRGDIVRFLLAQYAQEEKKADDIDAGVYGTLPPAVAGRAGDIRADVRMKLRLVALHEGEAVYDNTCDECVDWADTSHEGVPERQPHPCETLRILAWEYHELAAWNPAWTPDVALRVAEV